jgi:hypothetical protein
MGDGTVLSPVFFCETLPTAALSCMTKTLQRMCQKTQAAPHDNENRLFKGVSVGDALAGHAERTASDSH